MTADELANMERILSLTLPDSYHRLMAAYPFGEYSRPSQAYILDDSDYLCNMNQEIRNDTAYESTWHRKFFAVGTSCGGDIYFLDTRLPESPVFEVSRELHRITEIAPSFDFWVDQLVKWHVDFNAEKTSEIYADLTSAVHAAGFFTTSPEAMDGWHRITIASQRRPEGGYTGNSFWVALIQDAWFAGAWGGHLYRVPSNISKFCIDWLTKVPDITSYDFDSEIKAEFNLQPFSDGDFEAITKRSS